jgi:hypothetical protein
MGETFRDRETRCSTNAMLVVSNSEEVGSVQQLSVYVLGPRWAGRSPTLLSRMATGSSGAIALPACRRRIGKDRELFRRSDPLTEQFHLTLHSVKATLGGGQLGTQLLRLAPQRPYPRAEVDACNQEQAHPDHHPPPHEAGPYPLGRVEPAVAA